MNATTITLDMEIKQRLDQIKKHPRESYNDVVSRLLAEHKSIPDPESLAETVEILSDPETMKSLARSLEDLRRGRVYELADV